MSLFNELKRRNVFRVGIAYVVGAWLLLQLTDVLSELLNLPETIGPVVVTIVVIGLPIVLFAAWAFEMTPEGIKKEKDVDRSQSITVKTGQKLNLVIIALLAVTLGYFVIDKFVIQPRLSDQMASVAEQTESKPADEFRTIAVLPFVNMSDDRANEYFSDGLTEELLNILAKIKELRVAGRTSSFAFKGQHEDLRLIGEKLNVATILEGSVRRDDKRNRVRITAQLINVGNGYHMWSETYDRELDDIFAIQDEIARKVAQAMRITILGEDEARLEQLASTEINAYDIYLRALQDLNENSFESLGDAAEQFQQAIALDPEFTPAKLGLINSWSHMADTGAITRQEALNRGMPLLNAIIEEHPDNSNARIQLAKYRTFQNDFQAAEEAYTAALEVDPRNVTGLQEFGRFLFNGGQVDRGIALIDAALQIEPYSVQVLWEHCQTNAFLQNIDAARGSCSRIREISPESPLGWYGEGLAYLHTGDMARATKGFADAIEKDPGDFEMISAVADFWLDMGDVEEAEKWLKRADAIGPGQAFPLRARLNIYQYREQHELAYKLARQVLDKNLENRHGSSFNFRQIWAFECGLKGDYQAGLSAFRDLYEWVFQDTLEAPDNIQFQIPDIIQIAALLKLSDPLSDRPEELLRIVEPHVEAQHPAWGVFQPDISRAAIATIRGKHVDALHFLNSAWDKEWRFSWRDTLRFDVVFSQLAGESGYQDLVVRFEQDMERQRELAYELMGIAQ
jgi:TolB-like protein/tetratricopeptide (TPR) repeat protein